MGEERRIDGFTVPGFFLTQAVRALKPDDQGVELGFRRNGFQRVHPIHEIAKGQPQNIFRCEHRADHVVALDTAGRPGVEPQSLNDKIKRTLPRTGRIPLNPRLAQKVVGLLKSR